MWPDFGRDIPTRRRVLALLGLAAITAASFLLGMNQSRFLTCEDFTISGNSEPPGCTREPTESGNPSALVVSRNR
jgi:hypothetical protein